MTPTDATWVALCAVWIAYRIGSAIIVKAKGVRRGDDR